MRKRKPAAKLVEAHIASTRKVLVIDVGGTNVKVFSSDHHDPVKIPSGLDMTPEKMVREVQEVTHDWEYDVVSVGFPAPIEMGKVAIDPKNLGPGWIGFDFAHAFSKPVKVINDASMQALGAYEGGTMLFMGLGTGLGSALIIDGIVAPLELAHLPYRKGLTYEDYVGVRGLEARGKKRWREAVADVVTRLKGAMLADYVVLGGGNSKNLKELPPGARLGDNRHAFLGGLRLWNAWPAAMPVGIGATESVPEETSLPDPD